MFKCITPIILLLLTLSSITSADGIDPPPIPEPNHWPFEPATELNMSILFLNLVGLEIPPQIGIVWQRQSAVDYQSACPVYHSGVMILVVTGEFPHLICISAGHNLVCFAPIVACMGIAPENPGIMEIRR